MATCSTTCLFMLAALVSLLMLTCSAQHFYPSGRYGKRFEVTPPGRDGSSMFWSGSRFGRSSSQHDSQLAVAPRAERFFMGSRYGKRSDWEALSSDGPASDMLTATTENDAQVTCLYTGITNLYRCYNRKDNSSEETISPQN